MWNNHCEISFPALSAALAALGFCSPSLGLSQEGKNLKSRDGVNTSKYIVEKAEKATVFGMYESTRHPRWGRDCHESYHHPGYRTWPYVKV